MTSGIRRFRQKPIVVEAMEWTWDNFAAIREFGGEASLARPGGGELSVWNKQEHAWIPCPVGHYVVKGALGELYPVSPAAIAATYEPAGGADPWTPKP